MGATALDEGCQDGTVRVYSLWVILRRITGVAMLIVVLQLWQSMEFCSWTGMAWAIRSILHSKRYNIEVLKFSCSYMLILSRFELGSLG